MDEKATENVSSSNEATGEPSKSDEKSSEMQTGQSETEMMDTSEPSKSDDKKDNSSCLYLLILFHSLSLDISI